MKRGFKKEKGSRWEGCVRIMYSCRRARSAPVPEPCLPVCICVCLYTRVPERTSTCSVSFKCHSCCFPSQTCLFPRLALCILKNSLTLFHRPPSMLFPQNVQSRRATCVCSFKSDFSEPSSDQIEHEVDNRPTLVIFNSGEQTTFVR